MKLGRYEVVRELGKGAMGVVYLAKDPLIGRLVALKTIRAAAHADDDETKEFQQRFIREAQAAGILNHPAIVTVHDIGQDETGTSFIAMEFVEGQNLKEVLAQGRALSFEQIGEIIAQVADALDFAHTKGIVHRDVKPANIILLDNQRAKITDFGIAKIASSVSNLTTTGQFLGTPNYMAPEQIKGAPVDGRTDIFSLGICLYECLTRRKPFGGDSLTSISYKIVHEPFPPLHDINPQIPDGYADIAAIALAKDPAKRYQRAKDLASALRAVIRGERPPRPTEPVAEDTIVTRDRDKVPTLEIPFPEAEEVAEVSANATRAAAPAAAAAPKAAAAKTAGSPTQQVSKQIRQTVSKVRGMPLWRGRIAPPLFFGIIVLLVAGLIGTVAILRSRQPAIPLVDTAAEAGHLHERRLRIEAEALLRQSRVADAYAKYEELSKLAPRSPFVMMRMQQLSAVLQRLQSNQQQLQLAREKFDEGKALFDQKKFTEAIESFQESFSLDPGSNETAEYLKLAQGEQQKVEAARSARREQRRAAATTTTAGAAESPRQESNHEAASTASASAEKSAELTTIFTHPFTDGRIVVRAGADIVANERLFDEKPARFFRRASRAPREVNVTNGFPAKNADVNIWVTVPADNINEHHVMEAVRFSPGTKHRLVVRYDQASKKFTYELN